MCGIVGFWRGRPLDAADRVVLDLMTDSLAHRGPDGRGTWLEPAAGVALGHRRLAIQDLSDAGKQPMTSADGRFVLTYNGEIYNAPALREVLRGHRHVFRGTSDTEVLVEAISHWGIEQAIERAAGMFAAAVWDNRLRTLYLVRDRIGIKPLYWGRAGDAIVFSSELKALRHFPDFQPLLDLNAVGDYCRYGVVHAPRSIFKGIQKLEAGHILTLAGPDKSTSMRYWQLPSVLPDNASSIDDICGLLDQIVHEHLISDVAIGTFLSGGIDSSLTTAVANQARAPVHVTSFTVGFDDPRYDESHAARAIAEHLGTNHVEVGATPKLALDLIGQLPEVYDEPFADSSQLPTLLISKLAREHVAVVLSGDGGDELFAGYSRYHWVSRIGALGPPPVRHILARLANNAAGLMPATVCLRDKRTKLRRFGELAAQPGLLAMHDNLLAVSRENLMRNRAHYPAVQKHGETPGTVREMQVSDTLSYLPDDILAKVDRASMAVGLETRVPLLDHRLVELAFSLPTEVHVQNGVGKALPRKMLSRHLPVGLYERPKQGFSVPVGVWLDGPLASWADDLLSESAIRAQGFFDPTAVSKIWREHKQGAVNRQHELWMVLTLQQWSRHWNATP